MVLKGLERNTEFLNANRYTVSRNVGVNLFYILEETKEAIAHLN